MREKSKSPSPRVVKKDTDGAFAPSQADAENNGGLTISPDGDDDPRKQPDDHSAPTHPRTGTKPRASRTP